jgi:hypothetical protein
MEAGCAVKVTEAGFAESIEELRMDVTPLIESFSGARLSAAATPL